MVRQFFCPLSWFSCLPSFVLAVLVENTRLATQLRHPGLKADTLKAEAYGWYDCLSNRVWRRTIIGIGLQFFQQMIGVNAGEFRSMASSSTPCNPLIETSSLLYSHLLRPLALRLPRLRTREAARLRRHRQRDAAHRCRPHGRSHRQVRSKAHPILRVLHVPCLPRYHRWSHWNL